MRGIKKLSKSSNESSSYVLLSIFFNVVPATTKATTVTRSVGSGGLDSIFFLYRSGVERRVYVDDRRKVVGKRGEYIDIVFLELFAHLHAPRALHPSSIRGICTKISDYAYFFFFLAGFGLAYCMGNISVSTFFFFALFFLGQYWDALEVLGTLAIRS